MQPSSAPANVMGVEGDRGGLDGLGMWGKGTDFLLQRDEEGMQPAHAPRSAHSNGALPSHPPAGSNPPSSNNSGCVFQQDQLQPQPQGLQQGQVAPARNMSHSMSGQASPNFFLLQQQQQEARSRSTSLTNAPSLGGVSHQQPNSLPALNQVSSAMSASSASVVAAAAAAAASAPLLSQGWTPAPSSLAPAAPTSSGMGTASLQDSADASSASLYVKNLPPEASELLLYQHFAPHGAILSCKVLTDPDTGRCRGVGFVNYVDCAAAVRAAQLVHGTRIAEGRQVHVTLQAPRAVRTAVAAAASAAPQQQQQQQQQQQGPQLANTLMNMAKAQQPQYPPMEGGGLQAAAQGGQQRVGAGLPGSTAFGHAAVQRISSNGSGTLMSGMPNLAGFEMLPGQQQQAQLPAYFHPGLPYSFVNIPEDSSLAALDPNSCPGFNLQPDAGACNSLRHLSGTLPTVGSQGPMQGVFQGAPSRSSSTNLHTGSSSTSGLMRPIQRPLRSNSVHSQPLDTSPLAHGALGSMLGGATHEDSLAALSALSLNHAPPNPQHHPYLY